MRRGISVIVVALAAASAADAETIIRTFVNGVPADQGVVRDLHLEVARDITAYRVVSGAGTASVGPNHRQLDVTFAEPLAPGSSVSVEVTSAGSGMALERWWWTGGGDAKVSRPVTYVNARGQEATGTIEDYANWMRGDEPRLPHPLPDDQLDPYAIVNKQHHWGGEDRKTREICIELDLRGLLAGTNRPTELTPDAITAMATDATRRWSTCSQRLSQNRVPRASPTNPNHGNNTTWIDPPVMAPGPSHGSALGATFRSVTERECRAAFIKYPCGLRIEVVTGDNQPGCRAPVTPQADKPRCNDRLPQSDGTITTRWGGTPDTALGYGLPEPDRRSRNRTGAGRIHIDPTPGADRDWHPSGDSNHDGWITNTDGPAVPATAYDFDSVFLHELGHVLCFSHAGSTYFLDGHAHYDAPKPLDLPATSVAAVFGTATGEPEPHVHETVLFAAELPGGHGGLDLWRAIPNGARWQIENLGPAINSSHDDTDPFLASDGTTLLFTTNRVNGEFAIFGSQLDLATDRWLDAAPHEWSLELPGPERHPTLPADMRTLYFSSAAPGGAGGLDIWAVEWVGDTWSRPFVLGPAVSSPQDDTDPSVSGDGRQLYIASNRTGTVGGFDLFRATLGDNGPPRPLALANTPADERSPAARLDGMMLYFTSGTAARVLERSVDPTRTSPPAPDSPTPPSRPSSGRGSLPWVLLGLALLAIAIVLVMRIRSRAS